MNLVAKEYVAAQDPTDPGVLTSPHRLARGRVSISPSENREDGKRDGGGQGNHGVLDYQDSRRRADEQRYELAPLHS